MFAPDGTRLGRIVTGVKTRNVAWGDDGHVFYIAANHWVLRLKTTTGVSSGIAGRPDDRVVTSRSRGGG